MVYYLFKPEGINNPYWYKYLDIYDTIEDYLWSYKPQSYFISKFFTVYICQRHEFYEKIKYNVCKLNSNTLLYYSDDIVYIWTNKRRDTDVLKCLNRHRNKEL